MKMPEGEYMFDPETLSNIPNKLLAAEITPGKAVFKCSRRITICALTVETESWEDFKNGDIKLNQIVWCGKRRASFHITGKARR